MAKIKRKSAMGITYYPWNQMTANFLFMDHIAFDELLSLLCPCIENKDTVLCQFIPSSQKLSITFEVPG